MEDLAVCERCGEAPMEMLKTPAYDDHPPVYEVGCIGCPPEIVETSEGMRRRSFSARGWTPEMAREKWNNREYVVDTKDA